MTLTSRFTPLALALALLTFHTHAAGLSRSKLALQVRAADPRIAAFRAQYRAQLARREEPSAKKLAAEKKLVTQALELRAKLRQSKDDRPILIAFDGMDGVGKSATWQRLKLAFEGVREIEEAHFLAPPKGYDDVHWTLRYIEKLPKRGSVMFWDRSMLGDLVYPRYFGTQNKRELEQRASEVVSLEELLANRMHILKFSFEASGERLAKTIAKRELKAPERMGEADYRSFRDRKVIRKLFRDAAKRTSRAIPWHLISMNDREAGREKVFRIVARELTK